MVQRADAILFSGGAQGAEAEFGAAAERHGVAEVNFTFEGVVSKTRIFTPTYDVNGTTAAIGISDRITLPSGFTPQQPPILSVEPHYDHKGPHHYEVYV